MCKVGKHQQNVEVPWKSITVYSTRHVRVSKQR